MAKKVKKKATKKKRPVVPIRYKRNAPPGTVKQETSMVDRKQYTTGTLLEFKYGGGSRPQKQGEVGRWKNDPKPVLLVFYDDGHKYIEGINTNYLSGWYLKKLRVIMKRFPGLDGEDLYKIFKRTALFAIKKGYRKYIRTSLLNTYVYVYKDELTAMLNPEPMIKTEDDTKE